MFKFVTPDYENSLVSSILNQSGRSLIELTRANYKIQVLSKDRPVADFLKYINSFLTFHKENHLSPNIIFQY